MQQCFWWLATLQPGPGHLDLEQSLGSLDPPAISTRKGNISINLLSLRCQVATDILAQTANFN